MLTILLPGAECPSALMVGATNLDAYTGFGARASPPHSPDTIGTLDSPTHPSTDNQCHRAPPALRPSAPMAPESPPECAHRPRRDCGNETSRCSSAGPGPRET